MAEVTAVRNGNGPIWAKANETGRLVSRTAVWVALRARQGKIRRKQSPDGYLYHVVDARAAVVDNQPMRHASRISAIGKIRWVIDGVALREFSAEKAIEMIAQIVRGVE